MLVLRRKVNEGIIMNGVIKVIVLAVEGDRCKLGIEAPPDVVIVRDELLGEDHPARRDLYNYTPQTPRHNHDNIE